MQDDSPLISSYESPRTARRRRRGGNDRRRLLMSVIKHGVTADELQIVTAERTKYRASMRQ